MEEEPNAFVRFVKAMIYTLDGPVTLFREKIVEPNQKKYPWYHQKFRRVPSIEECHERDIGCYYEANSQFHRDMLVEQEIVAILRRRYEDCCWTNFEEKTICADLLKTFNEVSTAYFIKYGDLGAKINVLDAFMKQKHRMLWERRNGPVGSGEKENFTVA